MAHISGQERELGIDVSWLAPPAHEAVHGKSPAQLVQVRRTVGTVTIGDLGAVDTQTLQGLLKVPAGCKPCIGSALGQDDEDPSLGRNPELALAQFEQVLPIGEINCIFCESLLQLLIGGLTAFFIILRI